MCDYYHYGQYMIKGEYTLILGAYKESMTAEEMERIKEIVYSTAYTAEKNGFYLGIRTALTMFVEAMQLPDDPDKS